MPITGPRADAIDKEIRQLKAGMFSGDFMRKPGQRAGPGPQEQKMIRSLTIAKMTPTEKAAFKEQERKNAVAAAAAKSFINAFKYTKPATLTKAKTNASIEKLRALSLDDSNPEQWLNFYRALPSREIRGLPIGKFRFKWGTDGKPIYVPWTRQAWANFFEHAQRGRWIPNQPFMYKCSPEWETHWINKYFAESENQRRHFNPRDYRHVWQHTAGAAICKKPKKSLWMKIRTPVVAAVAIVAAVYLGPIVLAKVKAVAGGVAGGKAGAAGGAAAASGGGSSAVAAATTSQKILSGAKTLVGYVNKARTIKAVVKGELPPPPIGIGGATFGQWAMIVAKEEIKKAAIDKAMDEGVKYIEKKMTQKEENKIKAEIAELQRQIDAATPRDVRAMPPEPMPELAAPIKKIQQIEVARKDDLEKYIIPGALVAGALILGG